MFISYANGGFSFIILRDIHYRLTVGRVSFIYSFISYANFGLLSIIKAKLRIGTERINKRDLIPYSDSTLIIAYKY